MTEDFFNKGEIVWGKLNGNPWSPAIIDEIIDETDKKEKEKEKKYLVTFVGENSNKVILKKKCIAKFKKNYKNYSITNKKELSNIIKIAKELYDNNNNNNNKNNNNNNKTSADEQLKKLILKKKKSNDKEDDKDEKEEEKEKEKESEHEEHEHEQNIIETSSDIIKEKSHNNNGNNGNISTGNFRRFKKIEDKAENELIYKICTYLRHLTAIIVKKDNSYSFEKNKEYLCKIFSYLSEYKINEPIDFLKKSNLGKYVKFINDNVQNNEIKQATTEVYKNLEAQVLSYLFKQK